MKPFLYRIYGEPHESLENSWQPRTSLFLFEPLRHLVVELHPPNQKILEKNETNLDQNIMFKFWKWVTEWLVYKEMRIKYSILLQDFGVQKLSEWPEVQVEKVCPP